MSGRASSWVLVTGAAGFVGSRVACSLRERGHRVAGLLRETSVGPGTAAGACDTWLRPSELAAAAAQGPLHAVVHLATAYGHDGTLADVVESNLLLPARLLDLCRTAGCSQFINADTFFGKPQFDYPHLPAYIRAKRDLIGWAGLACAAQPRLHFSNLRLEHVYGEGDGPRKFVPDLIARLQRHQPDIALTPGDQTRDFVYVGDVAQAFACLLDHGDSLPVGVTEYEVGRGIPATLRELVETARKVTASPSRLDFGALPHRPGEIMASVANTGRLAALGWRASTSLAEGLRRTASAGSTGAATA